MNPTITGTPAAVLSKSAERCEAVDLTVPPLCDPCRQQKRWIERTVGWLAGEVTRFKAVLRAVLAEHDDILASFCGICLASETPDCECFVLQYRMIGLPMAVPTSPIDPDCPVLMEEIHQSVSCYVNCPIDCEIECATIIAPDPSIPTCWRVYNQQACQPCLTVNLDPCGNATHLDIMLRAYAAASGVYARSGGGAGLLEVLAQVFPASVPQIVRAQFGEVVVTLGRDLTEIEVEYLPFLSSLIPLGVGVRMRFATICLPE